MASKIKVDQIQTGDGTGTIALQNQLSGMTSASMPAGTMLQTLYNEAHTQIILSNDTSPGSASGLSIAITPRNTSSKVLITVNMTYSPPAAGRGLGLNFMRGSTIVYSTPYSWIAVGGPGADAAYKKFTVTYLDSPNTASAVTYSINVLSESGNEMTVMPNGTGSELIVQEIAG
tara:strand:- start:31 stop:552 length:522 start_codon:yes stop_codon:yes gene_type:complete